MELEQIASDKGGGSSTQTLRDLYFQRLHQPERDPEFDRRLVASVLEQARRVIAHPSRPQRHHFLPFTKMPFADLAIEESLEDSFDLCDVESLLVETQETKPFSVVAMLDTSSSMSGEKHLLASIAVAVMLLRIPSRDIGVVTFASEAKSVKKLLTNENPASVVLRFLQAMPKGFTNIHIGLDEALKQYQWRGTQRRRLGIIATDGRSTEGRDPVALARQFDFLAVIHLQGPGSHRDSSIAMAQAGKGVFLEVESFDELPGRIYDALKLVSRY